MALVVFNQKGGVGKSTITCNLAAISAAQGLRTLVALRRQADIRRFRGRLMWEGDLEAMRTDG